MLICIVEEIKSNVNPELILHVIKRLNDIKSGREDLINSQELIQISTLKLNKNKKISPHKHISKKSKENIITQESLIVIKGLFRCILYDIDDTILREYILEPGDSCTTLYGAHSFESLTDDTIIYEIKNGPYLGQTLDNIKL